MTKPCFIIAEAGVNHNGNMVLAKRLIDIAKRSGADAVKFQMFKAENEMILSAPKAKYQETDEEESQYEMVKKLELSNDQFRELAKYAKKVGIIFLASPFDYESVDLLCELKVPYIKIASGEITNYPFLEYVASKKIPIILSTGMATLEEVNEAVGCIYDEWMACYAEITILHCTSSYPTKMRDVNLNAINTLRETMGMPVGLSDHTLGITIPIAAVAMGACMIEKHFTIDKTFPGPDHSSSLSPFELEQMVKAIRDVEKAMGNGIKKPTKDELETMKVVRRSIVSVKRIPKGSVITEDMLAIKKPGTGIEPKFMDKVVGRKAKWHIDNDELISFEDLI